MKLYVATHNQHKVREISEILPGFEIVPDDPEGVVENAPDFAGNALIKVRAIAAKHRGEWCMADDSGLEVCALGGAPGVRSARYAGEPSNTPANNALLLKNLEGVEDRVANFTCSVALVDPEGREHVVAGKCFGRIARTPSGAEGFGYDPLFIPDGHDKSFAELTADEKNAISHRGRALEKAKAILGAAEGRETGDDSQEGSPRLASNVSRPETQTPKHSNTSHPWLRLFRVVNLPTVPGDVFVGAAAAFAGETGYGGGFSQVWMAAFVHASVWWAAGASVFLYMFGLAQNDIMGVKTDKGRPIPDGEISMDSALAAATACIGGALFCAYRGGLFDGGFFGDSWLRYASSLLVSITLYNRFKKWWLMGACRGLNVMLGAAAVGGVGMRPMLVAVLWWLYISLVTLYSEGEEADPEKKRRVGMLVGGVVYLQLAALIAFALAFPQVAAIRTLLVAGAGMLILLRIFKAAFPRVSAS